MKKKKNAFTLIELLAIIVILAIIAVITVPIILNIIENSRKGAATDSAYGYKDSINKYYLGKLSENPNYNELDGTYDINSNGYLEQNGVVKHQIEVSGQKPSGGTMTIENKIITTACVQMGDYKVSISNGTVGQAEKGSCSSNGNQQGGSNNNNGYTVTYNTNGGSTITSDTVDSGETITKPTDPTRYGYLFVNWYSDAELTSLFDFSTPITSNTNLYAKWEDACPGPKCIYHFGNEIGVTLGDDLTSMMETYEDNFKSDYNDLEDPDGDVPAVFLAFLANNDNKVERVFVCTLRNSNSICLKAPNTENELASETLFNYNKQVLDGLFTSAKCSANNQTSSYSCGGNNYDDPNYGISAISGEYIAGGEFPIMGFSYKDDRACSIEFKNGSSFGVSAYCYDH